MSGSLHVGVNETLNRNTGTYVSPVWLAVNIAQDVDIPTSKSMAEVKARLSTWVMNLPAMKGMGLEFGILGDKSQANWAALRDAYLNDTLLDFAVCDSATIATSGAEYLRLQVYLSDFPIAQKLEEAEVAKVSGKLAYNATPPAFTNVA